MCVPSGVLAYAGCGVATIESLLRLLCLGKRELVEILSEAPHRVTEVAAPFEISLAAASKHIQMLERAGLVERRISGRDHVLSLRAEPLEAAADWIDPYRRFWESK